MKRVISIIGKTGSLASALRERLSDGGRVTCYGKDQINMLDPGTISDNINNIKDSDVIIICSGTFGGKVRDVIDVNASGPIQMISELAASGSDAHVVVLGSHANMWTSWPGISIERLAYNTSKRNISEFVTGLEQSGTSDLKLTVYHVSKFDSNMNPGGRPIQEVVDTISWIINSENPPLVVENGKNK